METVGDQKGGDVAGVELADELGKPPVERGFTGEGDGKVAHLAGLLVQLPGHLIVALEARDLASVGLDGPLDQLHRVIGLGLLDEFRLPREMFVGPPAVDALLVAGHGHRCHLAAAVGADVVESLLETDALAPQALLGPAADLHRRMVAHYLVMLFLQECAVLGSHGLRAFLLVTAQFMLCAGGGLIDGGTRVGHPHSNRCRSKGLWSLQPVDLG